MKMFRKVLAAGVALTMAVTGMTMGASATDYTYSWMVRRVIINGHISSNSVSSSTITYTPGTGRKVTKVRSRCTSYSSGTTGNDNTLGADCYVNRYNSSGVCQDVIGYYHHTNIGYSSSFDMSVSGTDYVRAEYSIDHNYIINCYIDGTATGIIVNL